MSTQKIRINTQITAPELRVIDADGTNLGILPRDEALARAQEQGLDLIEVSAKTTPPIAKIMDYGKFSYEQKKKERKQRSGHKAETKTLQIKIGTGEHDLDLKANKAAAFLREGHRVKIDLFLAGRAKYLDEDFLKERLNRFLVRIPEEHKVSDGPKKSPKGFTVIVERAKK